MPRKPVISEEDQKLISDAFSVEKKAQVIQKDVRGRIIQPTSQIVNQKGFVIKSFMGRTIKRNKFLKKKEGPMVTVAKVGMKYEDVPSELRKKVMWSEADFN